MKPQFWERVKQWVCRHFGHKAEFSHHYGKDHYVCRRCGFFCDKP